MADFGGSTTTAPLAPFDPYDLYPSVPPLAVDNDPNSPPARPYPRCYPANQHPHPALHGFPSPSRSLSCIRNLGPAFRKQAHAFTLVELLVVIGIIAVLISLLLPALNRARQSAVSIQCQSNLKNIGNAALLYAHEFRGWFPPGHSADYTSSASHEKFLDYGANQPNRWIISELMAKYAGYKVPVYPPPPGQTYVAPNTPIFGCPADDQPVSGIVWPDNGLLNRDPAVVGNNGNSVSKIRYWWVANPAHAYPTGWDTNGVYTAAPSPKDDGVAAKYFMHLDKNPTQEPGSSPGVAVTTPKAAVVDYDLTRACTPGIDYLRKSSDKGQSKVAICVDRSRSGAGGSGTTAGWWYMHGNAVKKVSAWKNELFGDGHCESVREDQMKYRWGNPTSAGSAYGW